MIIMNALSFETETELKRHKRSVHMKEKLFKRYYNSCDKTFVIPYEMQRHKFKKHKKLIHSK